MTLETFKDVLPYLIGILSTIIALKKDWISSQFTRKNSEIDVAKQTADLYQDIIDDVQKRFDLKVEGLEAEIVKLQVVLEKLQSLVEDQERIIRAYREKYGDLD